MADEKTHQQSPPAIINDIADDRSDTSTGNDFEPIMGRGWLAALDAANMPTNPPAQDVSPPATSRPQIVNDMADPPPEIDAIIKNFSIVQSGDPAQEQGADSSLGHYQPPSNPTQPPVVSQQPLETTKTELQDTRDVASPQAEWPQKPLMTNLPRRPSPTTENSTEPKHQTNDASLSKPPDQAGSRPTSETRRETPSAQVDEQPEPETPIPTPTKAEVDLWWGYYSSWALTPSWVICTVATVLFLVAFPYIIPREYSRIAVVGFGGAVWLMQIVRWVYRIFGYTYRLTTRTLYIRHGWSKPTSWSAPLLKIKSVTAHHPWWGKWINIGTITAQIEGDAEDLVLEGVRHPERTLKQLRNSIQLAKEQQ